MGLWRHGFNYHPEDGAGFIGKLIFVFGAGTFCLPFYIKIGGDADKYPELDRDNDIYNNTDFHNNAYIYSNTGGILNYYL